MKKVLVLLVFCGLLFAENVARNWRATVYSVTQNARVVTGPYAKNCLGLQSQTIATASVTLRGANVVVPSDFTYYYPMNFNYGEAVTLNVTNTNNVLVIWTENNIK